MIVIIVLGIVRGKKPLSGIVEELLKYVLLIKVIWKVTEACRYNLSRMIMGLMLEYRDRCLRYCRSYPLFLGLVNKKQHKLRFNLKPLPQHRTTVSKSS